MATDHKPGDLFRAHSAGDHKSVSSMMKRMKSSGPVKHSGTFEGKSNALGHGGRAAQLKARGVPGGVIGELARRAHAAPGQANFHGKKAKKAKKVAEPAKDDMEMAMKKKRKASKGNDHDADDKKKSVMCKACKSSHPVGKHSKKKSSK